MFYFITYLSMCLTLSAMKKTVEFRHCLAQTIRIEILWVRVKPKMNKNFKF